MQTFSLLIILLLSFAKLGAADWRRITSAEHDEYLRLYHLVIDEGSEEAWQMMERLSTNLYMAAMKANLRGLRRYPQSFERFRAILLAKPDWEEWVQWKIDNNRAILDKKEPSNPSNPEVINPIGGYGELTVLQNMLEALGTVETIPFHAQFLFFPYLDAMDQGLAFQHTAAGDLNRMRIPGAPNSTNEWEWQAWWKKNEPLYRKGPDGKIHGPGPTRFLIQNGKMTTPPEPGDIQAPSPGAVIPAPTPPVPDGAQGLKTPLGSVPQTDPARSNRFYPVAFATGIAVLALLVAFLRKRR